MSKSSRKGARREREWADKWNGHKVSRLGYEGPDVVTPSLNLTEPLRVWEVKSKEALPKWLVDWLEQVDREGADALAFRQNRGDWYVIIRADRLEEK